MRRPGAADADDPTRSPARRSRGRSAKDEWELRQIVRTKPRQTHAKDVMRQGIFPEPLAGSAPAPDDQATRHALYAQLWGFADPIPSPWQVVERDRA